MNDKIDSLIFKSRIFLGITGTSAIISIAYYLLFNVNVAAVIKASDASQSAAFGIVFPAIVAFIIAAYSFMSSKKILKLSNMQTIKRADGGFKTKRITKAQKKEHNTKVNRQVAAIIAIFAVSAIVLIYWIYFISKLGTSFSYLTFGNHYLYLVYRYSGTALLVIAAASSGLAAFFAGRIRAFNF